MKNSEYLRLRKVETMLGVATLAINDKNASGSFKTRMVDKYVNGANTLLRDLLTEIENKLEKD